LVFSPKESGDGPSRCGLSITRFEIFKTKKNLFCELHHPLFISLGSDRPSSLMDGPQSVGSSRCNAWRTRPQCENIRLQFTHYINYSSNARATSHSRVI